ncbi:MAG: hypothetical protein WAW07_01860 [Bacteroidales bacterium]
MCITRLYKEFFDSEKTGVHATITGVLLAFLSGIAGLLLLSLSLKNQPEISDNKGS